MGMTADNAKCRVDLTKAEVLSLYTLVSRVVADSHLHARGLPVDVDYDELQTMLQTLLTGQVALVPGVVKCEDEIESRDDGCSYDGFINNLNSLGDSVVVKPSTAATKFNIQFFVSSYPDCVDITLRNDDANVQYEGVHPDGINICDDVLLIDTMFGRLDLAVYEGLDELREVFE
jgi:hypothetical protein